MVRQVEYIAVKNVKNCVNCPLYDEVTATKDMTTLYLCTDPYNQKIADDKETISIWFEKSCRFKEILK